MTVPSLGWCLANNMVPLSQPFLTPLSSLPFLIRQMVPGTEMSRHLCGRSLGGEIWRGGMSAIITIISKILGQAPGKLNLEELQPHVLENSPQSAGWWAPPLLTQDFLWWCSALWWQTCRNYHVPLVAWFQDHLWLARNLSWVLIKTAREGLCSHWPPAGEREGACTGWWEKVPGF